MTSFPSFERERGMKSLFRTLVGLRVLVVAEDVGELLGVGLELLLLKELLFEVKDVFSLTRVCLFSNLRFQFRQSRKAPLHSRKHTTSNM